MQRIRPAIWLLPLVLALAILFYRLLLGEVFFWGLPSLQFTPWRETALELLRAGSLPWWNALSGAGAPLLANYQSALLYPFSWPSFVLPVAWTMSITAVIHLFIAGWGMWAFSGALGASPLGRAVSALAFGLTSYLVARAGTYPIVSAAAWLPWLMWAAHGLCGVRSRRSAAWLAVFTALLLLAGHAQTAWYSLLLTGLYIALLAARARRVRPLGWAVAGLVVGVLIASLQLIPTAELLLSSQRGGGVEREFALNFSYAPVRALNLFAPNAFGSPADGTYYTEGVYFEDAVYVGLLPLIAGLSALVKWPWRRRARDPLVPVVAFFTVIIVGAFVLALGRYTPIFPFLYDHVPTFDLFQAPVRWHLWTVFGLSVLSAVGVTWWNRGASWTRRAAAFCIAALSVGIIGSLALTDAPPELAVMLRALSVLSATALAAVILTLIKPQPGSRYERLWNAAVLLVVAADLVWANQGLNPTTGAEFYEPQPATTTQRAFWPKDALDAVMFEGHLRLDDYRMTPEQIAVYRASGLPNLNLLDGGDLFSNFDPLLVGSHARYVEALNAAEDLAVLLHAAGISTIYDEDGQLQVIDDAPLAWLALEACRGTDEETIARLNEPQPGYVFDPRVHLAGEGGCYGSPTPWGGVISISPDLTSIRVQVDAFEGEWLVVARTWYPGWTAAMDGIPTPIERANLTFSAVFLPVGQHTVTFTYAPVWLLPALALSSVGLAGLTVFFALAWRERRYNANQ